MVLFYKGDSVVWVKLEDKTYLNADSITSTWVNSRNDGASIFCQCGEFVGQAFPSKLVLWEQSFKRQLEPASTRTKRVINFNSEMSEITGIDEKENYDPTYNIKMNQEIMDFANALLLAILTELEIAKKNNNVIFDLPKFINSFYSNE